jgi:hypothetical protein
MKAVAFARSVVEQFGSAIDPGHAPALDSA